MDGSVIQAQKTKPSQDNKRYMSSSAVKPDPPKNLQVKPLKNSQVEVSWEYPDSWSTPHSYFSLKFFVRIQRKTEKMKEADEGCNQVGVINSPCGDQWEDPNNQVLATGPELC